MTWTAARSPATRSTKQAWGKMLTEIRMSAADATVRLPIPDRIKKLRAVQKNVFFLAGLPLVQERFSRSVLIILFHIKRFE